MTGAAYSHLRAGSPAKDLVLPLAFLLLGLTSWALRPASRRVGPPARQPLGEPYVESHAFPSPSHIVPQF